MRTLGQFDTIPENGVIAQRDGEYLMILFDFEKYESLDDAQEVAENTYVLNSVTHKGASDYGLIIASIINDKYSTDDVQALIANYTEAVSNDEPSDKDKEYIEEYKTFQEYRKHAKEIAKAVTEMEGV
jgi:hypothetical protein